MPRPIKDGIAFFYVDIDYWDDDKICDLVFDCGLIAELVYVHLIAIIYKQSYYIEETSKERIAKRILRTLYGDHGLTYQDIIRFIDKMADCGLLDKKLLEQGVFTSRGIQKQYYTSTIRRKEREHKYWLLNDEDEAKIDVRVIGKPKKELNGINVNDNEVEGELLYTETRVNVNNNEQNKNKKKKKKEIDKNDKYDKGNYPGYLHYCTACLIEDKFLTIYDPDIPKFNELFDAVYREYGRDFELFHRCFTYCRDYVNRNKENIDDKFNYFKVAFTNSMEHMEGYDERMQNFREAMDEILRGLR